MKLFEWTKKIAVGIDTIDEQHKKLISIINDLNEAMKARKASEVIGNILQELSDYTVYHFGNEERAFDKYNYPKKEEHKALHKIYVDKIAEFIERNKKSELGISINVLDFLIDWITNHIMKIDMQYVPFFSDKEIG
ncbi:MAG: hemerythrin family protein [Treponema sp.]|jgi:methyl-accepting chemotaxis protein/hemerythrin|nr:hemerythrin family protein [Treponema sp.]